MGEGRGGGGRPRFEFTAFFYLGRTGGLSQGGGRLRDFRFRKERGRIVAQEKVRIGEARVG